MNYNLTNLTSSNTVLDYAIATNDLTSSVFFAIVIVMIHIILFVNMKNFDTGTAFMSSSFVTAVIASILWATGLLAESYLIGFFSLFLISVFAKKIID